MKENFFSPGKLLITAEYFVLDGALALAVPTKLGQELSVEEIPDGQSKIYWKALELGQPWMNATINLRNSEVEGSDFSENAQFIAEIFKNIQKLGPESFSNGSSFKFQTNLQFPANYGLGSSSTLINNLADWANVDAFGLNEVCLGGSGYDIAVAKEKSAILYQNKPARKFEKVKFDPEFKNDLIFIHLNQKQNSREGISLYHSKAKSSELIEEFTTLTKNILQADTIENFSNLIEIHEQKLSDFLDLKTVKENLFADYGGFVKSLGAWGGDFVMASKFGDYKTYFSERNFTTIFECNDIVC